MDYSINEDAQAIWRAGVAAVDPGLRMKQFVAADETGISIGDEFIGHNEYRKIVVVGAGKSAGAMAAALEEIMDSLPKRKQILGQVNVPDDRVLALKRIQVVGCRPVGSNLPTERVLSATDSIIELLKQSHPDDLVIGLFSGGGSALLERPEDSISLADLQHVTSLLSRQGASIEELNCVRSQLSLVKLGGLAGMMVARKIVSLLISDVLGDPIEAIASGPTWIPEPDVDLQQRALAASEIIHRYAAHVDSIPKSILRVLNSKMHQAPAPNRPFPQVKHYVIANNQMAVEAAFAEAQAMGYQGNSETDFTSIRADVLAPQFSNHLKAALLQAGPSANKGCLVSGGEPTVQVQNPAGRGGRNQHLVLATMKAILAELGSFEAGQFCFLSGGTDGEDGNVAVAGAMFDSAKVHNLPPEAIAMAQQHLLAADSHTLLRQWSCLFHAGDTNTNVCDLRVLLWHRNL